MSGARHRRLLTFGDDGPLDCAIFVAWADWILSRLDTPAMRNDCSIVRGYASLYPYYNRETDPFPWAHVRSVLQRMIKGLRVHLRLCVLAGTDRLLGES